MAEQAAAHCNDQISLLRKEKDSAVQERDNSTESFSLCQQELLKLQDIHGGTLFISFCGRPSFFTAFWLTMRLFKS